MIMSLNAVNPLVSDPIDEYCKWDERSTEGSKGSKKKFE